MSESDAQDDDGFAPADLTDGREPGHWKTRWTDPKARGSIRSEAIYLSLVFLALPVATLGIWLHWPERHLSAFAGHDYSTFALYSYSVLGGMLGGTLFDLKWLYHSVAHGRWNRDRRLWRLFMPFIAGGLSFGMFLLATAEFVPLLDVEQLRRPGSAMGVSFLIGYFSDNTIGAMARLANSVLGDREKVKSHHVVDRETDSSNP